MHYQPANTNWLSDIKIWKIFSSITKGVIAVHKKEKQEQEEIGIPVWQWHFSRHHYQLQPWQDKIASGPICKYRIIQIFFSLKREKENCFLTSNGKWNLVVPGRVHSPEEFLIFIIHVAREAHVNLWNKSYNRENKPITRQNMETETNRTHITTSGTQLNKYIYR